MVKIFTGQFADGSPYRCEADFWIAGDTPNGRAVSLRRRSRIEWVHVRQDGVRDLATSNLRRLS